VSVVVFVSHFGIEHFREIFLLLAILLGRLRVVSRYEVDLVRTLLTGLNTSLVGIHDVLFAQHKSPNLII
jgi:hypothetical protein